MQFCWGTNFFERVGSRQTLAFVMCVLYLYLYLYLYLWRWFRLMTASVSKQAGCICRCVCVCVSCPACIYPYVYHITNATRGTQIQIPASKYVYIYTRRTPTHRDTRTVQCELCMYIYPPVSQRTCACCICYDVGVCICCVAFVISIWINTHIQACLRSEHTLNTKLMLDA